MGSVKLLLKQRRSRPIKLAAQPQDHPSAQASGALAYVPAIVLAPVIPAVSLLLDAFIAVYFAVSKSEVPGLIHRAAIEDPS